MAKGFGEHQVSYNLYLSPPYKLPSPHLPPKEILCINPDAHLEQTLPRNKNRKDAEAVCSMMTPQPLLLNREGIRERNGAMKMGIIWKHRGDNAGSLPAKAYGLLGCRSVGRPYDGSAHPTRFHCWLCYSFV